MILDYVEVVCEYSNPEHSDWIMASLASEGFESFVEDVDCVKAYLPKDIFQNNEFNFRQLLDTHPAIKSWNLGDIEAQNWNERWESNYSPVIIEGKLLIRAPFHAPLQNHALGLEINIEPKMSFGTGHHATTKLMATRMLELDFKGKKVLDMGCGTGILAILASKLGADYITAIDNHPWACINTLENCEKNAVANVAVMEGDAAMLGNEIFDIVLANINRNVLLDDMRRYTMVMPDDALLVISGFLMEDLSIIAEKAQSLGLRNEGSSMDGKWMSAWFRKAGSIA